MATDSLGAPLREGDRVTFCYFFPCGRCPVCLQDDLGSCPRKGRANRVAGTPPYFNNAFGEYYYLRPGHWVFRVPDEVSDTVATPANCALSQVLYGLQKAGLRFGQSVVVQGAGGLGINAVAVARDMGADIIIAVDGRADRLELARAFGADHTLSLDDLPTAERRIEAVRDLTGGFGADIVADFVGYPDVIPEGLRMLRSGGCYLEVGSIAPGNLFSYDATALVRGNVEAGGNVELLPVGARAGPGLSQAQHPPVPFRPRRLSHIPAGADHRGLPAGRLARARRRSAARLARGLVMDGSRVRATAAPRPARRGRPQNTASGLAGEPVPPAPPGARSPA